ncbi:putative RNA methyltransferase [Pelagibius sp. Alg239-R121]|uniref:putative RNA methyltransferase n=1 Tax=Pelagibius sp. Alg239-R121 TaxID=2993448 RepID=UPI0024A66EDD|nr:methyltransferase domain-containing protein [Pelagibius sp. Alg239-R121]
MTTPPPSALHAIPFICPLDGLPLAPEVGSLICANRHSFDISASGYINLLPVQYKKSRDPGDSKSMVTARRQVLDAGLFDPLADVLCEVVGSEITGSGREATGQTGTGEDEQPLLVDAGCGEGFYTARLAAHLQDNLKERAPKALGVDISKWAVMAAAKRHKNIAWVVASNKRLPLLQGAPKVITSLFGFETWPDWAQLQNAGQSVIVVDAGPRHLIELREIIYPTLQVHEPPVHEGATANSYELVSETSTRFEQTVHDADLLIDLLEMTPHGRKSGAEARDRVKARESLSLSFDAVIRTFRHR